MMRKVLVISLAAGMGLLAGCKPGRDEVKSEVDSLQMNYSIRSVWPHDTEAFTQGLLIHNGELYESTGQKGTSWIGLVDVKTGKADRKVTLDNRYFGEGISILNNKIYQLTWEEKVGFVYDLKDFRKLREFPIDGFAKEGWGLTHDNKNLIMSDGTNRLHFLDTVTLKPVRTLLVTDEDGNKVDKLNELEYIEGFVYANVWQTNKIMKIDPANGKVGGRLDLTPLANDVRKSYPQVDVLNGIAWHPGTRSFLVTGKHWPYIYILKIEALPGK